MITPDRSAAGDMVLLVEADKALADLIVLSLERVGFQVVVTKKPGEVVQLVKDLRPVAAIVDIFLPGHNGLDLLTELKKEGLLEDMTVIVITAYGFMEVLQNAILAGAKDFVIKPFDVDVLVSKLCKWTGVLPPDGGIVL